MIHNEVTITTPEGAELKFYMRTGDSAAALELFLRLDPLISDIRFDKSASKEVKAETARKLGDIIFPDEAETQQVMRVILSGPHDQLTWYLDASWMRMVVIAADWLTRAKYDMKRSMREESARLERVSERLSENSEQNAAD